MSGVILGTNGMPKVILDSGTGYRADVYLQGCHLASWRNPAGHDLLFVSKQAKFEPSAAIRGGIPICFPQFADMGPCAAQHGFARNLSFRVIKQDRGSVCMELSNEDIPETQAFTDRFKLEIEVRLNGGSLEQVMRVRNPSTELSFEFTAALHTYFALVCGIDQAAIEGLKGITYLNSLQNRKACVETADEVMFPGEVDRIYCAAPHQIVIKDGKTRQILVEKAGFEDVVVWNPAATKSQRMSDFGDEEWREMVCLEVAQAGSGIIRLPPGGVWEGKQTLKVME
jgi:glucose-6-phosphate 1-epimerase